MSWKRFLRMRPWFRLTSTEGDKIEGQIEADNGLELTIKSGWSEQRLKLSEQEAMQLQAWLTRTYRRTSNDAQLATIVPISRGKADPGPSIG